MQYYIHYHLFLLFLRYSFHPCHSENTEVDNSEFIAKFVAALFSPCLPPSCKIPNCTAIIGCLAANPISSFLEATTPYPNKVALMPHTIAGAITIFPSGLVYFFVPAVFFSQYRHGCRWF